MAEEKKQTNERTYNVVFNLIRETDKAYLVSKRTKTINKTVWVPKSIVLKVNAYEVTRNLPEGVKYQKERFELTLPKWFCDGTLGFYR